jgi:hypothetical protein
MSAPSPNEIIPQFDESIKTSSPTLVVIVTEKPPAMTKAQKVIMAKSMDCEVRTRA